MMDRIIERIQKLLALTEARGATPEEAASAAAKAQSLLFEHNLSMASVERTDAERIKKEAFDNTDFVMNHHQQRRREMKWITRIRQAVKRGTFGQDDRQLAANFPTCAVGEFTGNSEAPDTFSPFYDLGFDFYHAVKDNDIPRAKEVYAKIHKTPFA